MRIGEVFVQKDVEPVEEWAGVALKGVKYSYQIVKFFWNNKWAIGALTVTWKTLDWIGDAVAFIKKYVDNPVVQGMMRYGLPAVAVAVALYGGKKLYDELVKAEDEEGVKNVLKDFKPDTDEKEKLEVELQNVTDKKKTDEMFGGFGTKRPKTKTITKRRPPEEDSVQDKVKKRRAMAAKGNPNAFKSGSVKEGTMVVPVSAVRGVVIDMIADKITKSNDYEQIAQWLKMIVGKKLAPRGKMRYTITSEDIKEAINKVKVR